jgi:REP-associated tyrosine transposase
MPVAVENSNHVCYHLGMDNLKHTTDCVYQTAYHIVWRPVYRRDVLKEPVKSTLENLLRTIAYQNGMEILAVDVQPDHIHLVVSFPPPMSIANAVKLLKGISARQLRLIFPELRKRTRSDRLWAPSYYVGTAGHVSADTIRQYIEAQATPHAH